MAELVPAPFKDLVARLYAEPRVQDSLFGLPKKKWYVPQPTDPDLSVQFHNQLAGNASGPAAGPHTQMAQNLLLSYAAGGRILELKTVQVNDRLQIPRPCIDMANIGYNVEWSQELRVEDSLREYVAGSMLIEMFRRDPGFAGDAFCSAAGEVVYDLSVGYDLAGIRSEKVQMFLDGMRDAHKLVEKLRAEIPAEFKFARELHYPTMLSSTLTLSTFHGCPADEIERICEFLIAERELDVIVKMNPPMLGKERLEHLLHDELGYTELTVNPSAYTSGLQFDEAVQLVDRLKRFAAARQRGFGCKFSNTLEVLNHRDFFTPDNKVQYLSGQPLHVITLTLTDVFRQAIGAEIPISFSAGIDRQNFASAVACGFAPVTTCSDLLKVGGYGRLSAYHATLIKEMKAVGANNISEFILDAYGQRKSAKGEAVVGGFLNTTIVAEKARNDPRYRAAQNRKVPPRIDSHLNTLDCITCEKCIPVCPNAAIFLYPTPQVTFEYQDVIASPGGSFELGASKTFNVREAMQIGIYADFCNECGNCDTFCPERGGPYKEKPGIYGSPETFRAAAPRDGLFIEPAATHIVAYARLKSLEYELHHDASAGTYEFRDGKAMVNIDGVAGTVTRCTLAAATNTQHVVNMEVFHILRYVLNGVLDARKINQTNAAVI